MDIAKLVNADKATRAVAKEASRKVAEARRRLKAAKKDFRGAKAKLRKARKLSRQAKSEARRAETQAHKSERKLSKALKETTRRSADVKKIGRHPSKPSSNRLGDSLQESSVARSSADVAPVAIGPGVRVP